jgi:hypothetical protein
MAIFDGFVSCGPSDPISLRVLNEEPVHSAGRRGARGLERGTGDG